MQNMRLPIMIADTSALRDLMDIEHASDRLPASKNGGQFSVATMIDNLCVHGGRTLMMPGSVLTELFPTITGRLTLATDEHGHAKFPVGYSQQMFPRGDQNALYQYFSKLAQEGKLRCYNSPAEMLNAGEVGAQSDGGVVFVGMGENRNVDGHSFSKNKNTFAMVPPGEASPASTAMPSSAKPFVKHNAHKDEGDVDTCNLLWHIDRYAQQYDVNAKVLFFNTDGGIYRRVQDAGTSHVAEFVKPPALVDTMAQLGMLDAETRPAVAHAMIELSTREDIWRRLIDRMQTPEGKRSMLLDSNKAKTWIEATQRSDAPTTKAR